MTAAADAIVVGAGLSGLVAACELIEAGRRVTILDQEPRQNLGAQAFWSLGGLFLVDSPEQRRMGIRDSHELAWRDWLGTAGFDRPEDAWPQRWAEAYVNWAAGEKRPWLRERGIRFFPVVGWAERGGGLSSGPGNSVPRFHVAWGTGPGVVEPFAARILQAERDGHLTFGWRHRVTELVLESGAAVGVRGTRLAPSQSDRGEATSREVVGDFEIRADATIVAAGGIGANFDLVRKHWPTRMGQPPARLISGVPDHVDGSMLEITEGIGARWINRDRMWHYTEGIRNWAPIWSRHGIRILPGPSSLWLDATGRRLPPPCFPGYDTLGTLEHIAKSGHDYTWFVLTQKIIEKEFALSGSEQNPDLTGRSIRGVLSRVLPGAPGPVQAFMDQGDDFVVAPTLTELIAGMERVGDPGVLNHALVRAEVDVRDAAFANKFTKDAQVAGLRTARNYLGDKLIRVARPHRLLDPKAGPLIAVRLNILTRKTLGGIETDLNARALDASGDVIPGLYAVGEAAGFGGGGMHGYRSLEGTFLGGCLFSGRAAGRHAAGREGQPPQQRTFQSTRTREP